MVNGRVLRQETVEQLVNPGRRVPAASTAIHGLTEAMPLTPHGSSGPCRSLRAWPRTPSWSATTSAFDLRFLDAAARSAGVDLKHPALDTLLLDATLFPGQRDHTLEVIAHRLEVSVVGRHTALDDALTASRRALRSRAVERSPGA